MGNFFPLHKMLASILLNQVFFILIENYFSQCLWEAEWSWSLSEKTRKEKRGQDLSYYTCLLGIKCGREYISVVKSWPPEIQIGGGSRLIIWLQWIQESTDDSPPKWGEHNNRQSRWMILRNPKPVSRKAGQRNIIQVMRQGIRGN